MRWLWMVLEIVERYESPSCWIVPYLKVDFRLPCCAICLAILFQLVVNGLGWSLTVLKLNLNVFLNPFRAIGQQPSSILFTKCIQNSLFRGTVSGVSYGASFYWSSLGNLSHLSSSLSKQVIYLLRLSILEHRLFCVEDTTLLRLTISMQQCSLWACFSLRASDFLPKKLRLLVLESAELIMSNKFVFLSCRMPQLEGKEGSLVWIQLMAGRFRFIASDKRILFIDKTYSAQYKMITAIETSRNMILKRSKGLDLVLLQEDLQQSQTCLRLNVLLAFQLRLVPKQGRQPSQDILKLCFGVCQFALHLLQSNLSPRLIVLPGRQLENKLAIALSLFLQIFHFLLQFGCLFSAKYMFFKGILFPILSSCLAAGQLLLFCSILMHELLILAQVHHVLLLLPQGSLLPRLICQNFFVQIFNIQQEFLLFLLQSLQLLLTNSQSLGEGDYLFIQSIQLGRMLLP